MAAALQIVPAGARALGGGVYQLPRRRGTGNRAARRGNKGIARRGKVGMFSRQWVWFAFALVIADALGDILMPEGVSKWVSVPAVGLYMYGKAKNKPAACNAALAIQGAHVLSQFGLGEMIKTAAAKAMGR